MKNKIQFPVTQALILAFLAAFGPQNGTGKCVTITFWSLGCHEKQPEKPAIRHIWPIFGVWYKKYRLGGSARIQKEKNAIKEPARNPTRILLTSWKDPTHISCDFNKFFSEEIYNFLGGYCLEVGHNATESIQSKKIDFETVEWKGAAISKI